MLNPLDVTHNVIEESISVITTKKEFILKQAINVVLLFVILLVFGCLDFATLTFDINRITTVSYWTTVFTKLIASVCALNIGINLLLDAEIKKDKILEDAIFIYKKLNKCKFDDFEYYVVKVYNREIKRKCYVAEINKKIYRLNKFSRKRDRLLYSSELPEMQSKKAKNLYCIKRKQLEELKSAEFIEKNIDSLSVRYRDVDPAIFELEIDGSQKIHQSKVRGSVNAGRSKITATTMLSVVLVSMTVTGFSLQADQQEFENNMVEAAHWILKAAEDIGIITWQLFRGIISTRSIVSNELTTPYVNRNKILKGYYKWRAGKGLSVPSCYLELNKEEEEEIIEISVDELNKIKEDK